MYTDVRRTTGMCVLVMLIESLNVATASKLIVTASNSTQKCLVYATDATSSSTDHPCPCVNA